METTINLSKGEITKNEKNSKILLLRKFNSLSSNKILIKSEVKDSFNSPEKFLCLDSKIIVNRKINLKKMFPLDDDTKQNINKTIGKGGPHGSLKYVFHRLNTFKGKSSINSKNSVIVGNNNYINNEVFKPDNIPDKHPKESQYSFNAMFQNLD